MSDINELLKQIWRKQPVEVKENIDVMNDLCGYVRNLINGAMSRYFSSL